MLWQCVSTRIIYFSWPQQETTRPDFFFSIFLLCFVCFFVFVVWFLCVCVDLVFLGGERAEGARKKKALNIWNIFSVVFTYLLALCPEKLQYTQVHFKPYCAFGALWDFLVFMCISKWHQQDQANLYAVLLFVRNKVA